MEYAYEQRRYTQMSACSSLPSHLPLSAAWAQNSGGPAMYGVQRDLKQVKGKHVMPTPE